MTTLSPRKNNNTQGRRTPTLERQAISFTVGLYLFICLTLLVVHYAGPYMPQVEDCNTSSTSPFNPC